MAVEIQIPSILMVGGGCFGEVPAVLKRLGCKRPLIVTDSFLMKSGLVRTLAESIRTTGIECEIFSETVSDPTTDVVGLGVEVFLNGRHDSLVSLGGGSPIDTAKAIGMLAANGGFASDYKVPDAPTKMGPAHIAIPTTAGTGSEVTRFTVISDSETNEKMLIAGSTLLPSAAIVDYELTMSMPARLTADTGTDSLTHAIEAYVSRRANAFSDMFALTAMRTIWQELPTVFHEPSNKQAREKMMLAATEAGIAFSNASVALVHGMSRPIGAYFHVPHGLSNAMLLPAVTAFSVEAAVGRYADCARAMGIADAVQDDLMSVKQLLQALYRRNAELEVPSPKTYGLSHETYFALIPKMAAQAMASGSPQNNPRIPTVEDICMLYRQVWDGSRYIA
ncbi:MAG TPA: iron-containing alcohol dehydrogenase [Edaphobacter sp.]|nr:iron-containing alcohol dehydrogenase [Edaphobacter sp.]